MQGKSNRQSLKVSLTLLFITFLVAGCTTTTNDDVEAVNPVYDMNSWKTEVPVACSSYFDGCNNCRRPANRQGGDIAACTRKFCSQYTKPICLDEPQENTNGVDLSSKKMANEVTYQCENKTVFTIFFDEYAVDDQRVKIKPGQAMMRDHQSHTVYKLTQQQTGSGMLYTNDTLEFRGKGDEAMIQRTGQALAVHCQRQVKRENT